MLELGDAGLGEFAFGGFDHLGEQGAVEREDIAFVREIVIAAHRGVDFEVAMAVETRLAACEQVEVDGGSARGRVAANGELLGDGVAVSEDGCDECDDCGKVPIHVEDVLAGIDGLGKVGDAVSCDEAVVRQHVHTRATDDQS